MSYTELEKRVFNICAAASMDGGIADISELVSDDLSEKQAGGVVSSLIKKGMLDAEEMEGRIDYWPVHPVHGGGIFWCDYVNQEDFDSALLK